MNRDEYDRRFRAVVESLKDLPKYLAEKKRKREERRIFVNKVFGSAWQDYLSGKAKKREST